jgi:hypothetical protein
MADPKKPSLDPFEAFKAKKAEKEQQAKQAAVQEAANKKSGWIDGIGPPETGKPDPNRPKGFAKGRYAKQVVNPAELAKLKPQKLDSTQLAKPKPTDVTKLPDEEKRQPKKFNRY